MGLATTRPTKGRPVSYCRINGNFTSIECGDLALEDIIKNPQLQCRANGIDLIFSEQNRILSCHVLFQNIAVRTPSDVTSRMPSAYVMGISSGVYLEALFYHEGILFEVSDINVENLLIK